MIRRFAPTVALCAVIAIIAAACVCALARPVERDTQPEAASTETVAAATKIAPAITKAAEQITKTPETITPEAPEETEPEEQPEEAPEEISRYAALNVTEDDIPEDFGDDDAQHWRYLVEVGLFTPHEKNSLAYRREITRRLVAGGFTRPAITPASDANGQHYVFECEISGGVDDG